MTSNLGTKFECLDCSTKFYDFKKPDPICPKCGRNQKKSSKSEAVETDSGK
jgi:hypothetical protein